MTTQQRIERIANLYCLRPFDTVQSVYQIIEAALTAFAEEEANKWQPIF